MSESLDQEQVTAAVDAAKPIQFESFNKPVNKADATGFETSRVFWDAIYSDPVLKEQLDGYMDHKIDERLNKDLEALKEEIKAKAHADAFAAGEKKGIEQGRNLWEPIVRDLTEAVAVILREKEALLRAHEKQWLEAFEHLLQRFLVPRSAYAKEEIEKWLEASLKGFPENAKIILSVPEQSAHGMGMILESKFRNLALEKNASLKQGEIRVRCDLGSVFFSPSEEFTKLQEMIAVAVQTESGKAHV